MTSGAPVNARPPGREQEGDGVRDLVGLEQPLHGLALEDHLREHALLGQAVDARLVGDLRLDERRADVAGQTALALIPCSAPSSASVFTRPSTPCFAET